MIEILPLQLPELDQEEEKKIMEILLIEIIEMMILKNQNLTIVMCKEQLIELSSINKPVKLITNDTKNLKKIRLKHIDYIIEFEDRKKNLDILKSICNNEVYYKSSKVIMSKGKQYSSESNWLENIPMSKSFEKIKPTQEFANELEEFKLFKLND